MRIMKKLEYKQRFELLESATQLNGKSKGGGVQCLSFHAILGKIWPNNRLAQILDPPAALELLGNINLPESPRIFLKDI